MCGLPSSDATALFTGIFSLLILKSNKLRYAGLCGLRDPANRYEHAPTSIQNEQFNFHLNNMQSMSVVRAPNILCSVIFAVVPYLVPTTKKKKNPNKTTHTTPPPQIPSCLRWNLPQQQILQVNLLRCLYANGELWDSQECSKTSQ